MSRSRLLVGSLLLVAACAEDPVHPPQFIASPNVSALTTTVTVVMSNLNSPRGLAFGPEGGLYVTEAGTTTSTGLCTSIMEGPNTVTRCYSGTGSVSRYWKGEQQRIASGLPSSFIVQSGFAGGPNDISFAGRGNGYVAMGWGGDPARRNDLAEVGALTGTLLRIEPNGKWHVVADISAFEGSHNPASGVVDSNPYGVLAEGRSRFVTDAGGNSLLEVGPTGEISLIATFPSTVAPPPFNQSEAVPTKVERGPDGALYVSTLSGVPFLAGAAAIYRVVPGQAPVVYEGGFKAITDFTFGPDGSLYLVQFATAPLFFGGPGALIHVAPDGTRSTITTDLFQPTGVTVGPDGAIYVSNNGTNPGEGEVLKIVLTD
jgi:hypothetical protein